MALVDGAQLVDGTLFHLDGAPLPVHLAQGELTQSRDNLARVTGGAHAEPHRERAERDHHRLAGVLANEQAFFGRLHRGNLFTDVVRACACAFRLRELLGANLGERACLFFLRVQGR
jgi:hypothetical protein